MDKAFKNRGRFLPKTPGLHRSRVPGHISYHISYGCNCYCVTYMDVGIPQWNTFKVGIPSKVFPKELQQLQIQSAYPLRLYKVGMLTLQPCRPSRDVRRQVEAVEVPWGRLLRVFQHFRLRKSVQNQVGAVEVPWGSLLRVFQPCRPSRDVRSQVRAV